MSPSSFFDQNRPYKTALKEKETVVSAFQRARRDSSTRMLTTFLITSIQVFN